MENKDGNIATSDDYTGNGAVEEVNVIETNEELEQFLEGQNSSDEGEGEGQSGDDEGQSGEGDGNGDGSGDAGSGDGAGESGDGAGEGAGAEDGDLASVNSQVDGKDGKGAAGTNDYDSTIHLLDDRFKLGMNLDQLPKDMDAATEAKLVGDIFHKVQQGLNAKLGEYEDVRQILQDNEVKDFIAAKKDGKTMRDFAIQYAQTTEGLNNEQLIREELKVITPNASEEYISKIVEGHRTAGTLDETADAMRETRKAREVEQATQAEAREQADAQAQLELRTQEVKQFGSFLKGINKVYGVPLTEEMRNEAFVAATRADENGDTYLDKALQSDEGVLRATLGLLHLEKLINASASTGKNKALKTSVDRLFSSPEELQSGGSGEKQNQLSEEDEIIALNQM